MHHCKERYLPTEVLYQHVSCSLRHNHLVTIIFSDVQALRACTSEKFPTRLWTAPSLNIPSPPPKLFVSGVERIEPRNLRGVYHYISSLILPKFLLSTTRTKDGEDIIVVNSSKIPSKRDFTGRKEYNEIMARLLL